MLLHSAGVPLVWTLVFYTFFFPTITEKSPTFAPSGIVMRRERETERERKASKTEPLSFLQFQTSFESSTPTTEDLGTWGGVSFFFVHCWLRQGHGSASSLPLAREFGNQMGDPGRAASLFLSLHLLKKIGFLRNAGPMTAQPKRLSNSPPCMYMFVSQEHTSTNRNPPPLPKQQPICLFTFTFFLSFPLIPTPCLSHSHTHTHTHTQPIPKKKKKSHRNKKGGRDMGLSSPTNPPPPLPGFPI